MSATKIALRLTTPAIKIHGILIAVAILSPVPKWIVGRLERSVQAVEVKKRAQALGSILRHAFSLLGPSSPSLSVE
jgi:hypothetical protein